MAESMRSKGRRFQRSGKSIATMERIESTKKVVLKMPAYPEMEFIDIGLVALSELMIDLWIRIKLGPATVRVLVDRGEGEERWWPDTWPDPATPRFWIVVDKKHGTAAAGASVGSGDATVNYDLGSVQI